jgi:hypothetical protein
MIITQFLPPKTLLDIYFKINYTHDGILKKLKVCKVYQYVTNDLSCISQLLHIVFLSLMIYYVYF